MAAILLVVLGNPLSGLTSSPAVLPKPWGAVGQLLPPGSTGPLLRNVGFFNGHHIIHPVVVLSAWPAIGLVLCGIAWWRRTDVSADDELIDEVIGVEEAAAARSGDHAPQRPGRHETGAVTADRLSAGRVGVQR